MVDAAVLALLLALLHAALAVGLGFLLTGSVAKSRSRLRAFLSIASAWLRSAPPPGMSARSCSVASRRRFMARRLLKHGTAYS